MATQKQIFPHEVVEYSVEKHFRDYNPNTMVLYRVVLGILLLVLLLMFIVKVDVSVFSAGEISPIQGRTDIRTPISGVIDSSYVTENMHVVAGQELFKIRSQTVDKEGNDLTSQHKELAAEVADLHKLLANNAGSLQSSLYTQQYALYKQKLNDVQIRYNLVAKDFSRYSSLYKSKVISAEEYDKFDYEMKSAENDLVTAKQQQLSLWQADETRLTMQLHDMDAQMGGFEEQKDLRVIKAATSGFVQQLKGVHPGSFVTPNDQLGEISPDSGLVAEAYVLPKDIAYLNVGTPVRMQIDAFDYNVWGMLTGKVESISNDIVTEANQPPYFKVRCRLNSRELHLKNGYKGYIKKGMQFQARFKVSRAACINCYTIKLMIG